MMNSAFDVPDATDWLNTPLQSFADLENALHCQICKEFYDTPMITSCAHTFCSKCIRTSLSADGKCPACRSADQASKLRNNWAIQEIVSTFLAARTPALHIARSAREEKAESDGRRKRKRPQISDQDDSRGVGPSGRTTRSKSRRLAAPQGSQSDIVEINDSDVDGDFVPDDTVTEQLDDGLVECPLGCGKRMKIDAVDPHLDRCEEEREREKKSKSKLPVSGIAGHNNLTKSGARPLERINELNYSLLKDSAMTKKLNELGIPSWGSKQLMINRHREWVNLWNANCDSSSPRTKRELLQDLDVWERTQGGRAPSANGLSNSIMRKDFDGAGWAKKNQDDFSRLIADARRKKSQPTTQSDSPKEDEGAGTTPAELRSTQPPPGKEQVSSDPSSELSHSESHTGDSAMLLPSYGELSTPGSGQITESKDLTVQLSHVQKQYGTSTSEPATDSCSLPNTLPSQSQREPVP